MSLFDGPTEAQLSAIQHLFDTIVEAEKAAGKRSEDPAADLLALWEKCRSTVITRRPAALDPFAVGDPADEVAF